MITSPRWETYLLLLVEAKILMQTTFTIIVFATVEISYKFFHIPAVACLKRVSDGVYDIVD